METVRRKIFIQAESPADALSKIVSQCKSASVVAVEVHWIVDDKYFAHIYKTKSSGRGRRLNQIETWQTERDVLQRKRVELERRLKKIDQRLERINKSLRQSGEV